MKNHDRDFASSSNRTALALTAPRPLRRVRQTLKRLWRDQRGANFIEYGVLAFCIGVAGLGFVGKFGEDIKGAFERLGGDVVNIGNRPTGN
jgi:Flp pilus assembly pilin Flp